MSRRQLGLIAITSAICTFLGYSEGANAQLGKCNSGCWNMTPTDWTIILKSETVCESYYTGKGKDNRHNPNQTMGTTKAVGGVRTDMEELTQQFKTSPGNTCSPACVGTYPIEGVPNSPSDYRFIKNIARYACEDS